MARPGSSNQACPASRKRAKFAPRNILKLNESARIRMQRNRAAITASDEDTQERYTKQGSQAASRYRKKVRAQNEAEDVSRRKVRKLALNPTMLPPCREVFLAPRAPITLNELVQRRGNRLPLPPQDVDPGSEDDASNGEDATSDQDEHPSTSTPRELTLAEQWEANRARRPPTCPKCYEVGCAGCACLCEASDVWVEHGGHFFPTCKMCGGEECPGCNPADFILSLHQMSFSECPPSYTAAPWPSTPGYHARVGFEDINLEEYAGTFYAVITDDWQGEDAKVNLRVFEDQVVFDSSILAVQHRAFSLAVPITLRAFDLAIPLAPLVNAAFELIFPIAFPCAFPGRLVRVTCVTAAHEQRINAPRRLQQQFVRVLGPAAATPPIVHHEDPPLPPLEPVGPANATNTIYNNEDAPPRTFTRNFVHGVHLRELYAVTGHNRIFTNRERATAVWMDTPGADFFFSHNVNKIWEFLRGG
ncbi:hypothetical protein B0H16DRAFT_1740493 [Mycena metata]|uniref:Uncharacterized protein n=1 Tax=Mycena metata TaxID=1033252 RepID=A0AAD7HCY8_9AGAR|nr:hypothetical protein B0H16DRAFT_1740493 [Mycena metata]